MSTSPLTFTGISSFSDDLRTILSRSVAIASVPLQQMQNDQTDLLTRKQLLSDIRTSVVGLSDVVSELGSIGELRGLTASSTNSARVAVTLNGADQPGTYTISEITSIAGAASETSTSGYATSDETPVSVDGVLELALGGSTYEIDISADNNLTALVDAINALGAGVTASVINTGTGETPYYLSLTATATGERTLELRETAGESASTILTTTNQGANAVFKLNGLDISKSDNVINDVISGLTFTIVSKTGSGETVDLRLASSRSGLANGLAGYVSAYNGLREKLNAQIGETSGMLSGDYVIRQIQHTLRTLNAYQSNGDIRTLADLGIEFDAQGVMSFDTATFYSLSNSSIAAAFEFLGSSTTGFGALASSLEQISDPVTGLIKIQQNQYDTADARITKQMAELNTRIEFMQSSMSLKLQQADVLLAQLETQQTLLQASLEGLSLALYGKKDG
ncbi:MAG TPA: flagellar filament capping protein FliD [Planctomycetota bacterium]|nr:flagellar filament capping protein FliD [Planctomycetota bacterium]